MQVIHGSLVQIGQMAREVVTGLQKTLSRVLEVLEKTAPLAKADTAAIRNAPLGGLPVIDISPLSGKCNCSILGWATFVPKLAPWMVRRAVDAQLADQLRQSVRLHNCAASGLAENVNFLGCGALPVPGGSLSRATAPDEHGCRAQHGDGYGRPDPRLERIGTGRDWGERVCGRGAFASSLPRWRRSIQASSTRHDDSAIRKGLPPGQIHQAGVISRGPKAEAVEGNSIPNTQSIPCVSRGCQSGRSIGAWAKKPRGLFDHGTRPQSLPCNPFHFRT